MIWDKTFEGVESSLLLLSNDTVVRSAFTALLKAASYCTGIE